MFSRTENVQTFIKSYPVVTLFIVIQLLVFVIDAFVPSLQIVGRGGSFHLGLAQGEWYRVLTANFIHLSLGHLLFNTVALIIFAAPMERMVGSIRFAAFYLITGSLSNVFTYLTVSNLFYLQAGASGALLGILGFYVYAGHFKRLLYADDRRLVYLFVGLNAIFTLIGSNVSLFGHLYGFLSGVLLAIPFARSAVPYTRPLRRGAYRPRSYRPPVLMPRNGSWLIYVILLFAIIGVLAYFF